jgi:hypothetical protein
MFQLPPDRPHHCGQLSRTTVPPLSLFGPSPPLVATGRGGHWEAEVHVPTLLDKVHLIP